MLDGCMLMFCISDSQCWCDSCSTWAFSKNNNNTYPKMFPTLTASSPNHYLAHNSCLPGTWAVRNVWYLSVVRLVMKRFQTDNRINSSNQKVVGLSVEPLSEALHSRLYILKSSVRHLENKCLVNPKKSNNNKASDLQPPYNQFVYFFRTKTVLRTLCQVHSSLFIYIYKWHDISNMSYLLNSAGLFRLAFQLLF